MRPVKNRIDRLVDRYATHCALPWETHLAGPQKVWFAVYDKADELKLRHRVPAFELATREAAHGFSLVDLTDTFGRWVAGLEYREAYFRNPGKLRSAYSLFQKHVVAQIDAHLERATPDEVVALLGVGSFFPMIRVSDVVNAVAPKIKGRLLLYFPGESEDNGYRLLDARDGWNYLAVPLIAPTGADA